MPFARFDSAAAWQARFGAARNPAAVTIGNFDGVHLGHQKILRDTRQWAARTKALAVVLTFYPHPARILRLAQAPSLLMTLEQRLAAIEALGMDAALVLPFDETLSKVSAEDFVRRYLEKTLQASAVVIGENFRFGRGQEGDAKLLSRMGLAVHISPPVEVDGVAVSSSAIRLAVAEGRVQDAARMLRRPFSLGGEIVPGTGQGRKLVVPTLNLQTEQELFPKSGVYATEAVLDGKTYRAATNIGVRPTFDGTRTSIESHLLDFDETLTGGELEIRFFARLRDERKFPNPAELRAQVLRDIDEAHKFFRASKPGFSQ